MRTYVIGDVHGRADLLEALLSSIKFENQGAPAGYRVIFLGDIIDRGPNSKQAMDLVVAELRFNSASRLIRGNHEEFLLLFLDRPDKRAIIFDHWMSNGGLAAVSSYGMDVQRPYLDLAEAHNTLLELLGRQSDHVAAMRDALPYLIVGDHLLVHAGLRPGVRLADQTEKDMRTIRGDFLKSDYDFGRIVVHGHSETSSGLPEIYNNRIALDTGACATGHLSALVLEVGHPPRFMTTEKTAAGIVASKCEPAVFLTLGHIEAKVARRRSTASA